MDINKVQPVHAVNKYLWDRISNTQWTDTKGVSHPLMTSADYEGWTPIVPVKDSVDLYTIIEKHNGIQSLPYVVYTWSQNRQGVDGHLDTHEIAYSIRSGDQDKMGMLIKLFSLEFKDYDRAALRVNNYIQKNGTANQKQFDFKYFNITSLGAEMPADTENGVDEALIIISATFADNSVSAYQYQF